MQSKYNEYKLRTRTLERIIEFMDNESASVSSIQIKEWSYRLTKDEQGRVVIERIA